MHNMNAPRHLTVRNVPTQVARALKAETRRRGRSLNQTVVDLLREALGVARSRPRNGIENLAGGWSAAELERFETATAPFGRVDDEIWR